MGSKINLTLAIGFVLLSFGVGWLSAASLRQWISDLPDWKGNAMLAAMGFCQIVFILIFGLDVK